MLLVTCHMWLLKHYYLKQKVPEKSRKCQKVQTNSQQCLNMQKSVNYRCYYQFNLRESVSPIYIWEDLPWRLSHQKFGNYPPSLGQHWGLFNHIWSLLVLSSDPIGRSESKYAKNMIKKVLHSLSNQIQTFLNFELTIF